MGSTMQLPRHGGIFHHEKGLETRSWEPRAVTLTETLKDPVPPTLNSLGYENLITIAKG